MSCVDYEVSQDEHAYFEVRSLATGRQLMQTPQDSTIGTLALSPDGRVVAAEHDDGSIHLQNLTTGAPIAVYHPTNGPQSSLCFGRDGKTLVGASRTGPVLLDVDTGRQIASLESSKYMYKAAFTPDHERLVVLVYDGESRTREFRVYDVGEDKLEEIIAIPDLSGRLAWSPDATRLAVAEGSQAHLWSVEGNTVTARLQTGRVYQIALSPDASTIAKTGRVLGALTLRMFVVGGIEAFWRLPFPLALGLLASLLSLLVLWMMLGGLRWSLRVPGFLAGAAMLWTVPLVIWGRSKVANFEIALCAVSILGCLILALKTMQYFGMRIVHTVDDEKRVLGGKSARQLPLKDALLWTAAARVAIRRGPSAVTRTPFPQRTDAADRGRRLSCRIGNRRYRIGPGAASTVVYPVGMRRCGGRRMDDICRVR